MKNRTDKIIPQGIKAQLPHGGLPEIISPYLINLIEKTGGPSGPIGLQFIAQPNLEKKFAIKGNTDPLIEDKYKVAPGLIYKYRGKINESGKIVHHGRVLWTITRLCASYCRFCTRGREVGTIKNTKLSHAALGKSPFLNNNQINSVFSYLKKHPEINEVILSGGDPLVSPQKYLAKIITGLVNLQKNNQLDIIRVGTRLPIANPPVVQPWHYNLLAKIINPYLLVHINHPQELTTQSLAVLNAFRKKSQATIMSQTVFLKNINDSPDILYQLFTKMAKHGIRPYYIYQNDPVYWAKHFTVPVKKAVKIWQKLRPCLSGIAATARFVIDTPFGFGKIPLPEGNAWKVNYNYFFDFKKKKHPLEEKKPL